MKKYIYPTDSDVCISRELSIDAQEIFFYFVNLQVKLSVRCTQRIYNEAYSEFVSEILFILI